MPIYEYQCSACQHTFETIQKISDAPLKTCPNCNKRKLQKLVSAPSFRLEGTGWYATDFKDKGKKPEDKKSDKAKTTEKAKPKGTKADEK